MMLLKAAIYTRVSTDNQAEVVFNSCEAQEAKIRAFISSQENMEVFKVYSDPGFTGANLDRPALTELLKDIEANKVNMVIVYKIDRLTRSPRDFYHLIEIFEKHGVSFLSVTERFDTSTPSGRLLRNIMLTFAQFERELTSERTKDKLLERAKKGLYGGGIPPFGYRNIEKKLIIDLKEAEVVRQIFNIYIRTGSLSGIYGRLKAKGISGRNGQRFSKSAISYLLRNAVYIGKISHNGNIYQGIHEPIISPDQFMQAQEIHKIKITPRVSPVKPFLFPGFIICKDCGSIMTSTFTNKIKKGKRKRYYYYRCTSTFKRDWGDCTTKQVSSNKLEAYLVQNFTRIANDNQYLDSLSFTLERNNAGCQAGFELRPYSPANIQKVIQNVVRIASIKEVVKKGDLLKRHIKNIIYSKETIEIKLYAAAADDDKNEEIKTERPKMPPSIFGRSGTASNKKTAAAGDFREKEAVCSERETPRVGFEPTTK